MDLSRTADQAGLFTTIAVHALLLLLILLFGRACSVPMEDVFDGGVAVVLGNPDEGGYDNLPPVFEEQQQSESLQEDASQVTSDDADAPSVQETPKSSSQTKPAQQTNNTNTPTTSQDKPRSPNQRDLFKKKGDGSGTGDGSKSGTQGDPTGGDVGGPTGQNTGSNGGSGGNGSDGDINGFKTVSKVYPTNEREEYGIIVVRVCVDANGKILSVTTDGVKGSTTTSAYLKKISVDAVKQWKFERIGNVSSVNCGEIPITYKRS